MGDWEAMEARLEQLEERVEELEREREERALAKAKRDEAARQMMHVYDRRMAQIRAEFGGEDE